MNSEQKAIFALRLGDLRNKKGLSQEELSSAVNIDRGTIAKYETQKRIPSYEHLTSFAEFFEVSTDYLLGITKNKTPDPEISMICEYTGLSDSAVQALNMIKGSDLSRDISILLDEMEECIQKAAYYDVDIYDSVLHKISQFFQTFDSGESQKLYISKSGKIINAASTEKEYTDNLSFEDCSQIKPVTATKIIEKIMLSDIEESLCKLRHKSLFNNPKYQKYLDELELPF